MFIVQLALPSDNIFKHLYNNLPTKSQTSYGAFMGWQAKS